MAEKQNEVCITPGQEVWYDANIYHGRVRQPAIQAEVIAVKKRVQIEFISPYEWAVGNAPIRRWVDRRSITLEKPGGEVVMAEECKHPDSFWIDDGLWCPDCNSMAGVTCPLCGGQGFMEENEMEADWINYGDELVTCRECGGKGWASDPSFQ